MLRLSLCFQGFQRNIAAPELVLVAFFLHSLSHLGFPLLLLTLTPSRGKRLPSETNIEKVSVDFKEFRKNFLQVWPSFPSPILKIQPLSWLLIIIVANAGLLRNECLMHLCFILYPGSITVIYGNTSMANDGESFFHVTRALDKFSCNVGARLHSHCIMAPW